jgi:hypothetical protein
LRSVTSKSMFPLDLLQAYEADILENLWYMPDISSHLICLLPKLEKVKITQTTPEKMKAVQTHSPSVVSSDSVSQMYTMSHQNQGYSPALLTSPSHSDHFLYQSNILNRVIQDIGYLQQLCQKQQQVIERLESRLESLESQNTGDRLHVLEQLDTETRLNYLESPPAQPAHAPVTYLPVYPVNSMGQIGQALQQPMDPMSSMMYAIQMAQMVQQQQSSMVSNG